MQLSVLTDNLPYLLWGAYPDGPLGGAALTVLLSVGSALVSALLGLALGIALSLARGWPHLLLTMALGFFRAIPVLMLIFWTYFLLPIVFHIDVPDVLSVMCALALIGGAYLAHSVHAGISGVKAGQWDAGLSLGMTRVAVLRHIVLPQALQMMLPSFINQWVTLIKDSSLAYIVGVGELSFVAAQVNSRVMIYPAEIFLFIGLIYFVLCSGLGLFADRVAACFRSTQDWRLDQAR
ncbi:amino acid ABC transporter permease [Collimonas silvisoli]|uniref:amino acid ABC transporter permease n=1 Tax=Collimonas silvisoli TaxID=2825884 RepID=UPI001B8C441B|nr:amino acid ABC transporter permease [Collimonas silvisoli]